MTEGAGEPSSPATGLKPGALSALLQELAASPEGHCAEPSSLAPGTIVGRFEIVRELGRGGFGLVYEAKDRDLGRQVALKLVRPGRVKEEEGKVSREAEAIARLAHPNLVTLFDVGRSEHGPYLVFELLRGKSLDLRIEEGPLPVQEAVHVATEVARGLAHAHSEGVVHRDLKPSNVLVTNRGQVKIVDFGMAHAFGRRRVSGGTPAYMAPEQWEGAPEDERTDVFALGVMLYRMLTGEYPYPEGRGRSSAEPATVRKLDVPGAPDLADLVETMLDPIPTHRPRDGAAVLEALAPIDERLRSRPADGRPPEHAHRRKATFGDLLAELKRRHVFRVMVGYGLFAFAVLQVTEPIMHGAGLPDWTLEAVLVALALGFPVAVVLAWVYDLTAQGVKRTSAASGPGAPAFGRARVLLPLAVSVAVLAIAAAGAGGWYAWKRTVTHRSPASATLAPSIAVLPFQDLSAGHDQEYFSDGMAEEILARLSRVKGLRVPGRFFSFSFKGKDVAPEEIARKLRVTHLLGGSVRRSGNTLRIRAEVVRARDNETVWNQTFERDAKDVLAVQDEIARSAVRELAPMLLAEAPPPTSVTVDPEAYRFYLLGLSLFAQYSTPKALEALQRSVALDPSFAPAQATLAAAASFAQTGPPNEEFHRLGKIGREAAERAVVLDPADATGYVSRGWYRMRQDWDWKGALEDLDRALSIAPTNEWALNTRGVLASTLGRRREAIDLQRRAVDQDPLNVVTTTNLAISLTNDGQLVEARKMAERLLEIAPGNKNVVGVLAWVDLLEGKAAQALSGFEQLPPFAGGVGVVAALRALGREQEARDALAALERNGPSAWMGLAAARAWGGDADGAFAALDRAIEERNPFLTSINGHPNLRPLRGEPRWREVLRKMNLPVDGEPWPASSVPGAEIPSIAVLPFADMSSKNDQEYFADGVAEEILNALSQVGGLKVIARTSSFSFKGKGDDIKTIGHKLGARSILEGSVRKEGNRIRITAKLIQADDGTQVWAQVFDRDGTRVFTAQEEIAREVVAALKVKLLPGGDPTTMPIRTGSAKAHERYLVGRELVRHGSIDDCRRALRAFQSSVKLDAGYAAAWAAIAGAAICIAGNSDDEKGPLLDLGRSSAERAIQLAPGLPDGYLARAALRQNYAFDWKGARSDLETALRLRPTSVGGIAAMAYLEAAHGRTAEAATLARRAVELDPLSPGVWDLLGAVLLLGDDLPGAMEAVRRAVELSPDLATGKTTMCNVLLVSGRPSEALAVAKSSKDEAVRLYCAAQAHPDLGDAARSDEALRRLEADHAESSAYQIAQIHARRGKPDLAFAWLARARDARDPGLTFAPRDPMLQSIRGDPRWASFLTTINLRAE